MSYYFVSLIIYFYDNKLLIMSNIIVYLKHKLTDCRIISAKFSVFKTKCLAFFTYFKWHKIY